MKMMMLLCLASDAIGVRVLGGCVDYSFSTRFFLQPSATESLSAKESRGFLQGDKKTL